MNVTWNQIARYFAKQAANDNDAPRIRSGRHAGKVDLNKMRFSDRQARRETTSK